MLAAKASAKRVPESSENFKPKRQKRVIAEDDLDSALSSDKKGKMIAVKQIKEKAQIDGRNKNEETISSVVASEMKSVEGLKVKLQKDRQNLGKGLSKGSKECELKSETSDIVKFEKVEFSKEISGHPQASKVAEKRGSVNIVALAEGTIIVAVDSRASIDCKDNETGEPYTLWRGDTSQKIREISPGVVITACGDEFRNRRLWKHLDDHIQNSIVEVALHVEDFLKTRGVGEGKCELLLAGCLPNSMEPVVYHLGDDLPMSLLHLKDGNMISIGNGQEGAKKSIDFRMTLNRYEASLCVCRCLVGSCVDHPCCGGDFIVAWIVNKLVKQFNVGHFVDVLLQVTGYDFKKTEILIISEHDHTVVNYYVLKKHFQREFSQRLYVNPACLGYVSEKYTCFMVDLNVDVGDNAQKLSDVFFEFICSPEPPMDLRYRVTTINTRIGPTRVLVMRATYANLLCAVNDARQIRP